MAIISLWLEGFYSPTTFYSLRASISFRHLFPQAFIPLSKYTTSSIFLGHTVGSMISDSTPQLEAKILYTLNHKRLLCRHPNESVLPLREPWSSTSTSSRAYTRRSTVDASNCIYDDVFKEPEEPSSKIFIFIDADSSEIASKGNLLIIPTPCNKRDTPIIQHRAEERRASIRPLRSIAAFQRLSRDEWTCYKLTHPCDTFNVQTYVVNLHASWDFNIVESTHSFFITHDACWVQVKWLACGTLDSCDSRKFRSIDIDTLENDIDTIVDGGVAFGSTELCL